MHCPSNLNNAASASIAKNLQHGWPQQWLCSELLSQKDLTASRSKELTSVSKETEKKNIFPVKHKSRLLVTWIFQLEEFVFIYLIPPSSWIFGRTTILGDIPWSHLLLTFHMGYSCTTCFTQNRISSHHRAV